MEKLQNEELHNLYFSPRVIKMSKSRRMKGAGHVACMGQSTYKVLVGTPERKNSQGRPRRRSEDDNNNMDLKDIGLGGGRWTGFLRFRIGTSGELL
jgi:hypothetical protein